MSTLCRYKYIFGKPNEGLHSYRIFNIAVVDLSLTILLAFLLSRIFNVNFWICFIILMLISVFFHTIFCVPTTITKWLGLV